MSKSADPTRAISPVPACIKNLPPSGDSGFSKQLAEDEYWGLLVPGWSQRMENSTDLPACNGEFIFKEPAFEGSHMDPAARMEGRIAYGGGANRLKIVWLKSHTAPGELAAGPLALLRVVGHHAEAYGVTGFRGDPETVRFDLERLGGEVVVTAVTDGCAGQAGDCDTVLQVYRPTSGRLDLLAEIALQRVRHAEGLEPGVNGVLTVKLVSSPEYTAKGIQVIEEFSVSDASERSLRRAQIERGYLLRGSKVVETTESLWERMYASRVDPAKVRVIKQSQPSQPAAPSGKAAGGASAESGDGAPKATQESQGKSGSEALRQSAESAAPSVSRPAKPTAPEAEAPSKPSVSSTIAVDKLR